MVVVDLAPGEHTVKLTLAGYDTLNAKINVGSTGIVTCVSVTGGACGGSALPRVIVSGSTVTGYLVSVTTPTPTPVPATTICNWITGIGGWNAITAYNIMTLVSAYAGATNLGFTVTAAHIMGAVAYYAAKGTGNPSAGNSLTGCGFT